MIPRKACSSLLMAGIVCGGAGLSSGVQAQARKAPPVRAANQDPRSGDQENPEDQKSGPSRFAEGFFTGRFRRRGLFSSLTLGLSNCVDGKGTCQGQTSSGATGKTKSSVAFTKEIGFRIPWALFGASYSLGFMKPSWSSPQPTAPRLKWAYQHSLLAVIRPTLPIWRLDLGLTLAPGWSRQVFRHGANRDRTYTQGFAMGVGGVASLYLTRSWIIGYRSDVIFNAHNTACVVLNGQKQCAKVDKDSIAAVNMAIHGLYLSHRW